MDWSFQGRKITVIPRCAEGWQKFMASCEGLSSGNEGPYGFGPTEQEAVEDLIKSLHISKEG